MPATLMFLRGRMAAASRRSRGSWPRADAVLVVRDHFLLATLFPGEIVDIAVFGERYGRIKVGLAPHTRTLLEKGPCRSCSTSPATPGAAGLVRRAGREGRRAPELHYVEASDALCNRQLKQRSAHLPEGTGWTSEAEFDAITALFQEPADEGIAMVRHVRD